MLAPPNRGHLIGNHFRGASAPGEEPFHSIISGLGSVLRGKAVRARKTHTENTRRQK